MCWEMNCHVMLTSRTCAHFMKVSRRFIHLSQQQWQQIRPRIPEHGEHALAGRAAAVLRNDQLISTNLAKDVLLYSFDKKPFFTYMTIFGAMQLVFWGNMAFLNIETYRRQRRRLMSAAPAPVEVTPTPTISGLTTAIPTPSSVSATISATPKLPADQKESIAVAETVVNEHWFLRYMRKFGMVGANYPFILGVTYLLIGEYACTSYTSTHSACLITYRR